MDQEVLDVEHRQLAIVDEPAPQVPALFGTDDPVEVIGKATRVADALKAVIVAKKLVTNIQGKEYPLVEAWQTLAMMLGIAAVCEWTRPIDGGWEARCIVQRNGLTIGAAEAQCTRDEKMWSKRDTYALRSMAQTRATGKSLRSVLGFVMVLAGYQATPAEEMPRDAAPLKPAPPERKPEDPAEAHRKATVAIMALCSQKGIIDAQRYALTNKLFGKSSTSELDIPQLRALYKELSAFAEGYQ